MELVKYEIYKIFSKKVVLIGLIILIPVYLIYNFGTNVSYLSSYREACGYYSSYEGKLDSYKESKITEGKKEVDALYHNGVRLDSKHLAMKILYLDMTNFIRDNDSLERRKTSLESELKEYSLKSFQYTKTALELRNTKNTKALAGIYFTEGWRAVINFHQNIGYWLVLILSLLGISGIISQEYSDGVNTLIRSTMKGRRELAAAKIAAETVYVLAVTTLVGIINLLTNAYYYGLSGFNVSLRNIYDLFQNSSVNMKIWQFYLIMQIYILIGALILCLLYTLLSIYVKNPGIPFAFILVFFLISDSIAKSKISLLAAGMLPSEFIRLSNLFRDYSYIYNVFGHPLSYEVLLFIAGIAALLVFLAAVIKGFEKHGLRE